MTLTSRAACDLRHPGLATTIRGGLLPPNPQRPAAGYEIFFQSFGPGPYHGGGDAGAAGRSGPRARGGSGSTATVTSSRTVAGIYMMTTPNFLNYSAPQRVATLNNWTVTPKHVSNCIPESMARSDGGDRYVIMIICSDAGLRPIVATTPPPWGAGAGGFSAVQLGLYPIVTFQYSSTTLYQVSCHIRCLFL